MNDFRTLMITAVSATPGIHLIMQYMSDESIFNIFAAVAIVWQVAFVFAVSHVNNTDE